MDSYADEVKSPALNRDALGTTPLVHGSLLAVLGQNHDLAPVHKVVGLGFTALFTESGPEKSNHGGHFLHELTFSFYMW